jgi:hypothetical protein
MIPMMQYKTSGEEEVVNEHDALVPVFAMQVPDASIAIGSITKLPLTVKESTSV